MKQEAWAFVSELFTVLMVGCVYKDFAVSIMHLITSYSTARET